MQYTTLTHKTSQYQIQYTNTTTEHFIV